MSVREVAIPDLAGVAADLFSDHCVVAITPVCGDHKWADEAVWSVARAAASTGRRTALVDLNLDDPRLHIQAKDPKDTGIVDAFLFGASLQHVASQEDDSNLHFIGVGTPPLDPEEVWASNRWDRLYRGFKKEEAILLLFLPPAALDSFALAPDLIMAVAPGALVTGDPSAPQVRSAIDRGVPVVLVSDKPDPAPPSQSTDTENDTGPTKQRNRLPRKVLLTVLGVAVTAAVAIAILRQNDGGAVQLTAVPETATDTTPPIAGTLGEVETTTQESTDSAISMQDADEPASPVAPAIAADPLPYSIQVAAWGQLSQALEHLVQFHSAGIVATITAVPRDSGRQWYRVFVGAVADYGAADELRRRLRDEGLIGSNRGVLLNTPLALLLETHTDTVSGQEAARGLRESGIPAYIVSMPDGSAHVLVGAFESPDQAELSDSVFPEADRDLSKTLVTRVGIAR